MNFSEYAEPLFLAHLQAKFGNYAKIPTHDAMCCGIYWHTTCLDCLQLLDGHDRQNQIPRALQVALGFHNVAEKKQPPPKPKINGWKNRKP